VLLLVQSGSRKTTATVSEKGCATGKKVNGGIDRCLVSIFEAI